MDKMEFEELARAWDVLMRQRKMSTLEDAKIGYKQFYAEVKGVQESSLGKRRINTGQYLYPIQSICEASGLPPVTGLVVLKKNGKLLKPSSGYASNDLLSYEVEMEAVLNNERWEGVDNPFWNTDGSVIDAYCVITSLQEGGNVLTRVQNRGYAQTLFRKGLLEAYGGRCAVCGIAIEEVLDAAHVKPWSVCEGTEGGELTNGILLCKNHHRTFDKGRWSVADNYVILGSSVLKDDEVEVDELRTPANPLLAPDTDYLAYHRNVVCKSKFDRDIVAQNEYVIADSKDVYQRYLDDFYDDQLKYIQHYKLYPQMMPFIGSYYRLMSKRVLIVGESHYLEPGCEVHMNADNWYAGLSPTDFALVNEDWMHTRRTAGSGEEQSYKRKAFTIFRHLEEAIKESLSITPPETDNYFRYAAFYNYFQRPAEAKISIENGELDNRIAYNHLKSLYEVLGFTHLAFVSKRAYHTFTKRLQPQDFKEVAVFATAHPACSWWNREHKHQAEGRTYRMTSKKWFLEQLDGLTFKIQ